MAFQQKYGNLSPEMVEYYTKFFKNADRDKDGCMSKEELRRQLERMGFKVDSETMKQIFNDLDTDGNKVVELDEFLNEMGKLSPGQIDTAELRKTFKAMDTSGDGTLDHNELRAGLRSCKKDISEQEIAAIIKDVDKDGDNKINIEEFLSVFNR